MDKPKEGPETGCCPRFNPEPWQDKEVVWDNKLFLKDRVRSFLHIPLNYGSVMTRSMEKIESAGSLSPQQLTLSDEGSPWKSNVYIAVSKEVPGAEMDRISGTFLSRAFEGSYKNMGRWIQEMKSHVKSKGKEAKKMYFFYTTCPKCAKVYGKNYTVILAKV